MGKTESTKTNPVIKITVDKGADTDFKTGELYQLEIKNLRPDPNQPRKSIDDDELQDLAASIKNYGVLQPILFRKDSDGTLCIVSGERRYQASIKAGKTEIPAIFTTDKPSVIALIENILRVDLTPIEEAEALQRLQNDEKLTNKQLGNVVSKKESTVSEILSINKISEKLRNKYRTSKDLSKSVLIEVAKADVKKMGPMLKKAADKQLTRDDVRASGSKRTRQVDAIFKTMAGGLRTRLQNASFDNLESGKKQIIASELEKLVDLIQKKLTELRG